MDVGQMVSWVLQLKEIIALVAILGLVWFIMTKHIPFLLLRESERAEREAARHQANHNNLKECINKLDDTMRTGLDHIKEAVITIGNHALSYPKDCQNYKENKERIRQS